MSMTAKDPNINKSSSAVMSAYDNAPMRVKGKSFMPAGHFTTDQTTKMAGGDRLGIDPLAGPNNEYMSVTPVTASAAM